jgi:hypothetical protein
MSLTVVEGMIHNRLEEKSLCEENWQAEEDLWTERFCVSE